VKYLSRDWVAAADAAVRSAAVSAPPGRVVIDQIVEGALSYRVSIDSEEASIVVLDHTDSAHDAQFSQSLATAMAVAQGTTDAHQAFLLGHIRFSGDVNVLIERRESLAWLEAALAPLLQATTFDDLDESS